MYRKHLKDKEKLLQAHRESHSAEAIAERLEEGPAHNYLKDFIYGAIDGAVTTFAVVCGVAGAELPSSVLIILGMANLIADGFSMAVSNFLGTRAEEQLRHAARRQERLHIRRFPEGEREEIRQIFSRKGFSGDELEHIVEVITADEARWVDTMLQEELGISLDGPVPFKAGFFTFIAFAVIGLIPLIPFLLEAMLGVAFNAPFAWSVGCTAVAFFIVGAFKSRFVEEHWYIAGAETLLIGGSAAVLAYGTGYLLRGLL